MNRIIFRVPDRSDRMFRVPRTMAGSFRVANLSKVGNPDTPPAKLLIIGAIGFKAMHHQICMSHVLRDLQYIVEL